MRSDLRSLRERIRQVEAGGHRDTPLRRAYNHKLRAHRTLRGGGGLPNEDEFNALNDKVSTLVAEHEKIWGMLHKLKTKFSTLQYYTPEVGILGHSTVIQHRYAIVITVIGPVIAHGSFQHSLVPVPCATCRMCLQRIPALQLPPPSKYPISFVGASP